MPLGLVLMDPTTSTSSASPSRTTPQWLQAVQQVTAAALPVLQQFARASPVGGSPVSVENVGPALPVASQQASVIPGLKNEHLLLGLGAVGAYFFFLRGRR